MQRHRRSNVVNEDFDPSGQQRTVLNVLKDEYQLNPLRVRKVTGLEKQRVNDALGSLVDAGWVETPNRGLYRLVYDGEGYVTMEIKYKE